MDFERCSAQTKDAIIVAEERGRKLRIKNPTRLEVTQIEIDGCLIDDERPRCDYVFEIGRHCAIYLELKGRDVKQAYQQLAATLGYLESRHLGMERVCHIVATRVPRATPGVIGLKAKMAAKHGVLLHIHTGEGAVDLTKTPYAANK